MQHLKLMEHYGHGDIMRDGTFRINQVKHKQFITNSNTWATWDLLVVHIIKMGARVKTDGTLWTWGVNAFGVD